jgi:hypothetical protein
MDGQEVWQTDKIDSVVGQLERLDELNRQPRSHEVSHRTVDSGTVGANIDGVGWNGRPRACLDAGKLPGRERPLVDVGDELAPLDQDLPGVIAADPAPRARPGIPRRRDLRGTRR